MSGRMTATIGRWADVRCEWNTGGTYDVENRLCRGRREGAGRTSSGKRVLSSPGEWVGHYASGLSAGARWNSTPCGGRLADDSRRTAATRERHPKARCGALHGSADPQASAHGRDHRSLGVESGFQTLLLVLGAVAVGSDDRDLACSRTREPADFERLRMALGAEPRKSSRAGV